jgi:hypothetical protein
MLDQDNKDFIGVFESYIDSAIPDVQVNSEPKQEASAGTTGAGLSNNTRDVSMIVGARPVANSLGMSFKSRYCGLFPTFNLARYLQLGSTLNYRIISLAFAP